MKKKLSWHLLLISVGFILYTGFCIAPFLLSLVNSFKTRSELFTNILSWPREITFANYSRTLKRMHYGRSFMTTAFIALCGISGIIACSSLAGWALARHKSRMSHSLSGLFIASMLIPFNVIMIPLYKVAGLLHLTNSVVGMGWIYSGLGVGMAIFMYKGFVTTIPLELENAAYIDGCTHAMIFLRIVFPLLKPVTATIGIMNILWMWNDFLLPLIMLQDSAKYTLLLSTNMLFGQYSNDWPAILSALLLAALPMLFLYIILQKQILNGIVDGALKG